MQDTMLVFGFGYTAEVLATRLLQAGWQVYGTSRSAEKRAGSAYKLIDFTEEAVKSILPEITHILVSTSGRQQGGDPVLTRFAECLAQYSHSIQWIGYLSTTGIYGDHQGAWVDETTPVHPSNARIRARFEAENDWLAFGRRFHVPVMIFRLAGIYGIGRNVLRQLKEGKTTSVYKENQVFSRIHVEDIAGVLIASIARPHCGTIYNVCDNEAAPSHEVLEYAAGLMGLAKPERIDHDRAGLSEMAKDFYSHNRRVKNDRIKDALGVVLQYPTYREGLKALFESGHY